MSIFFQKKCNWRKFLQRNGENSNEFSMHEKGLKNSFIPPALGCLMRRQNLYFSRDFSCHLLLKKIHCRKFSGSYKCIRKKKSFRSANTRNKLLTVPENRKIAFITRENLSKTKCFSLSFCYFFPPQR